MGVGKLLEPIDEREGIAKWTAKHDLSRGQLAVRIRCIPQLEHGSEEFVVVEGPVRTSVEAQ